MRIFQVDLHVFVLHRVHIYFNRIELCTEAAQWLYEFFSGFFIILLVFFFFKYAVVHETNKSKEVQLEIFQNIIFDFFQILKQHFNERLFHSMYCMFKFFACFLCCCWCAR